MSLFSIFAFFSQFGQVSLRAFVGSHSLARFRYPALALVGPCLPVGFALASRWLRVGFALASRSPVKFFNAGFQCKSIMTFYAEFVLI